MIRFSQQKPGCAAYQQDLGNSLTRLIGFLRGLFSLQSRKRLDPVDLPDHLRRDIGLAPHRGAGSFEDRWLAELRHMRR